MKVEILFVLREVIYGLQHHIALKFIEVGTTELMPTQLQMIMLLVVIGLYQLVDNIRIQEILVELIGRLTVMSTGVIQNAPPPTLGCITLVIRQQARAIRV